MFSPLLNIFFLYGGALLAGLLVAIILKAYFAIKTHRKIKDYQAEIVKSHAKILELEALNYRLESKLKDVDNKFSRSKLIMN